MSDEELQEQFKLCATWNDADQWDLLGNAYFQRGYTLNAGLCFKKADTCRQPAELAVEVI